MAGLLSSKRQRDEAQIEEINEGGEELKRQKSYNQILSLLEEEEEEAIEDNLSSIITTLQQEIISSPSSCSSSSLQIECHNPNPNQNDTEDYTNSSSVMKELELEEEDERERVMRHLLEASDDELGIVPNGEFLVGEQEVALSLSDALWELEDEAANYYTLFQSQLFM